MKKFKLNETDKQSTTFTEKQLRDSPEFKEAITGYISALRQIPGDSMAQILPAYVVIHQSQSKFTVTKFWKSPNKKTELDEIRFRNIETDISTNELIAFLLDNRLGIDV